MLRKLLLPSITDLAVSVLTLPLQTAPASNATGLSPAAGEPWGAEPAHYFRRYHRAYRYYRSPRYFYRHRHHRYYW
jgi:hypothetical protein